MTGTVSVIETPDSALVDDIVASPNLEPRRGGTRPDMLLLHYTGMDCCAAAVAWLTNPASKVSCHYAVDENGRVTQMVAEEQRAWHAGQSYWAGETDINSCSIGIEVHNPGHERGYPPFSEPQMRAVENLSVDIVRRHGIPRERVLAHSDVAPWRKIDPGEKFDWRRLAEAGAGLWVEPVAIAEPGDSPVLGRGARAEMVAEAQFLLRSIGYRADVTGQLDVATAFCLRAAQLHWRPGRVDSMLDRSTLLTLRRVSAAARPAIA